MRRLTVRIVAVFLLMAGLAGWAPLAGRPRPGTTHGFRLFARSVGALAINRVYCGMSAFGDICVDSLFSGLNGGGFWPKGTLDQYLFNSGFQFAGIIGPDGGDWAGDTTGGGFESGAYLKPLAQLYNYTDPDDAAHWLEAAFVPSGDVTEESFDPLLRGRPSASQGDVWSLMWDGDAAFEKSQFHPLGVVVETRGMGWNYPAGNEDILYFVFTFYNVTASDCTIYATLRPSIRKILCAQGKLFHELSAARFDVDLPPGGYTIDSLYAGLAVDADVGDWDDDFTSVNVPFSLGFQYDNRFYAPGEWSFDPAIFGPPSFAGTGFIGVKFLSSPPNVLGERLGLTQFSTYSVNEDGPGNPVQLWRYLSGHRDPAHDQACNTGDPALTHICNINNAFPTDMRFAQSSGPLTLPPGGAASVVVAYIFAAPVRTDGCTPPCAVRPDDPRRFLDPAVLAGGANTIDTLTGYTGFQGDRNGNGRVDQEEISTVPGSLLNKALVAQAVFDRHFLLPFAPEPPNFFLIPGDNQVTVLWRPSASEVSGDPFLSLASEPLDQNGDPNPLYDPNFRPFDVEGYRVYRGRRKSPNAMQLLAQFDYAGTLIRDYAGQVDPTDECAPELSIWNGCPETTPVGGFDPVGPGLSRIHYVEKDLIGSVVQVQLGKRVALANGKALITAADTLLLGGGLNGPCAPAACPVLANTGVPFVYVDRSVKNSFAYYYAVTAFDVNSFQSGASSLESPRGGKGVTPVRGAPTYASTGRVVSTLTFGRGAPTDDRFPMPTLDTATGRFSGPFPPTDAVAMSFTGDFVSRVLDGQGSYSVTLDSLDAGSAYDPVIPVRYYLTATSGSNSAHMVIPVTQDQFDVTGTGSAIFPAVPVTDSLARLYGGDSSFVLWGQASVFLAGNYYTSNWGRGCINAASPAFGYVGNCGYNGSRWFDGPSPLRNETAPNPNAGNGAVSTAPNVDRTLPNNAGFNNAGQLTGVEVIHQPLAYLTLPNFYRNIHGILGSFKRAADYNLYWSAATPGRIDSVVDLTHNVPLPLDSVPERGMNTGFGLLTQTNAQPVTGSFDNRTELTLADFDCVEPLRHLAAAEARIPCGSPDDPTDGPRYALARQASLGPIAFAATSLDDFQTSTSTGTGFALYLAGNTYLIQTSTLPAGVVWSLRDYVGAITGGHGLAGDSGSYAFTPVTRPFTAQGATVTVTFQSDNIHLAVTGRDLRQVHTVPDPYYVTSPFEQSSSFKVIKFVNLPEQAIIRIYSVSGVLVTVLVHNSSSFGGEEEWNVRNRNNQVVASGVYFYHIEANLNGGTARRVGRMTIVNFAD